MDCNRKIEWYLRKDDSALDKLDAAINILKECKKKYAAELKKVVEKVT